MKRHRPVRAWIGKPHTDPAELCGPRGLVEEVLSGEPEEPEAAGDDAFFASLMTPARLARIDAVIEAPRSYGTSVAYVTQGSLT